MVCLEQSDFCSRTCRGILSPRSDDLYRTLFALKSAQIVPITTTWPGGWRSADHCRSAVSVERFPTVPLNADGAMFFVLLSRRRNERADVTRRPPRSSPLPLSRLRCSYVLSEFDRAATRYREVNGCREAKSEGSSRWLAMSVFTVALALLFCFILASCFSSIVVRLDALILLVFRRYLSDVDQGRILTYLVFLPSTSTLRAAFCRRAARLSFLFQFTPSSFLLSSCVARCLPLFLSSDQEIQSPIAGSRST